jgi:hypothetical protein
VRRPTVAEVLLIAGGVVLTFAVWYVVSVVGMWMMERPGAR